MYPRIIVTSALPEEAEKLARRLYKRGIFAQTMSFDSALKLTESPELIIIMSKKYSSKAYAVALYVKAKLFNVKTLFVGRIKEYREAEIDLWTLYTPVNNGNRVSDAVYGLFDFNFTFAEYGHVASDLSGTPFLYFRGTRIFLTDTEHYIVHAFAAFGKATVSSHEIASRLGLKDKSIVSYASSINKKTVHMTGRKMIHTVYNEGYSLLEVTDDTKKRQC